MISIKLIMTFDPLKFYDDEQRKQRRYNSLLPVFLVAVVLLVAFYGFFVAYQRSHAKPKHAPVTTKESDWLPGPGNMGTQWIRCNSGMEATNLRDCPEYISAYRAGQINAIEVLRAIRIQQPRKRKTATTLTSGTVPVSNGANISNWDTYDGGFALSEPLPKPKFVFEDCDPVSSAQIGRYSDIIVTCSGHEVQLIWRDGPHETTPADITNLMEQIAPTAHADINLKPAPDCKMPADIDVCPAQMLDPKVKP